MSRKLIFLMLVGLLALVGSVGLAQGNHASLDVCCAWDDSLADGILTYTIDGNDATAEATVEGAVQDWNVVLGLTLVEETSSAKPDIKIRLKKGGGTIAGMALRKFDGSGFVKSVDLSISGKAFGDPNNQATIAEITQHEMGHALGVAHATFDDLMDPVVGGVAVISACDIEGVEQANKWRLIDGGTTALQPTVDSIDCSTGAAPADDLIIGTVTASANPATVGDLVIFTVPVTNHGDNDQTFTVTATLSPDNLSATTDPISLDSGASTDVPFTWDTTGAAVGDHTFTATHSLSPDDDSSNDSGSVVVDVQAGGEEDDSGGPLPVSDGPHPHGSSNAPGRV